MQAHHQGVPSEGSARGQRGTLRTQASPAEDGGERLASMIGRRTEFGESMLDRVIAIVERMTSREVICS